MDSAFDAAENYALAAVEGVDFLVKGNPAHLHWDWPTAAGALPRATWRRSGRNAKVAYLARWEVRGFEGQPVLVRRLLKVTKRLRWDLGDVPPGQRLLIKKDVVMTAETWLTSLDMDPAGIIDLYADHDTAEQYHSEIRGELDLEQLPSGSFKTNSLVLHLGLLAYTIGLWPMGPNRRSRLRGRRPEGKARASLLRLLGVLGKGAMRHRSPAKRHRMKTIIQELIRVPAASSPAPTSSSSIWGDFSQDERPTWPSTTSSPPPSLEPPEPWAASEAKPDPRAQPAASRRPADPSPEGAAPAIVRQEDRCQASTNPKEAPRTAPTGAVTPP